MSLLVSLALMTALLLAQSAANAGMAGGTPALGVLAARLATRVRPSAALGGASVAAVVAGGVYLPGLLGTSAYYILYLAGELAGSLALDAVGAFGLAVRAPSALRLLATALVLAAALAQQPPPQQADDGKQEAAAAAAAAATVAGAAVAPEAAAAEPAGALSAASPLEQAL